MKLKIQALGIAMLLFGSPIIHFFRDFFTIIPKSSLIMPLFSIIFLGMVFNLNQFKRIYKPNYNLSVTAWAFLGYSMFMACISPHKLKVELEIFNYLFLIIFFFVLCGVSNDIDKIALKYIILVVILCNLALIVSFIVNPFSKLGERATISNAAWGDGGGNPTLYALIAFAGIIASLLEYAKAKFNFKLIILFCLFTSMAVLLMTVVRSMLISISLAIIVYIFTRISAPTKQPKLWYQKSISKSNLYVIGIFIFASTLILIFFGDKILNAINLYSKIFIRVAGNVFETVLEGNKKADVSAGNRLVTLIAAQNKLSEGPLIVIFGAGYRFLYLDVPFVQVLLEEGLIGFTLILIFHFQLWKHFFQIATRPTSNWLKFWMYFYISQFVNSFTRGEPYDPYFWIYFLAMAIFIKLPQKKVNLTN
jgi:hypothetical protein